MFVSKSTGKITLVTGPMFSGKTLEILRLVDQLEYSNKEYVIFKPSIDNSEDEFIIKSRWNYSKKANKFSSEDDIEKYLYSNPNTYAVIIDEIQFMDKSIIKYLDRLCFRGINIIIGGLDRDYSGKPFDTTSFAASIADEVRKLHSICHVCGDAAFLSQKFYQNKAVTKDSKQIELKSDVLYKPVCRKHFKYDDN